MIEAILGILSSMAKIVSDWPARKLETARKDYANWRAGVELRREERARRNRLLESVDRLRNGKPQLPEGE